MKSVFSVSGESEYNGEGPGETPNFEIGICFNGVPNTVVLEVERVIPEMATQTSTTPSHKRPVMRVPLKSSHARAIASALLSAATEVGRAEQV